MESVTLTQVGQEIDKAIDSILNNNSVTLDDYIIFMTDFSDTVNCTILSGAFNSINGTARAV